MLKLADKIIFLISVAAMLGLLGAYASSYIDPRYFVFPSLLGLAYPYLLITNILLFLYWLVRWKKTVWLELLVLLLGYPTFLSYYGTAQTSNTPEKHQLSVLSYNIRYFDLYGWSNHKNTKEKLFHYLNQFKGQLLCLQEFSTVSHPAHTQEIIRRLTAFPYHYVYKDMAIFSRLPLLHSGHISFPASFSGNCIYSDILLSKDTLRLYNVHLESYKLGKKERQFMQEIRQGLKNTDFQKEVKNLTTRLTTANRNRAHQADQISKQIEHSPYPVIVCGDFNDTPLSYTYQKIKGQLEDSFIEKGRGLGNTYIGEFPSFRIDYILHSPQLQTVSYCRDTLQLSDHYPIQSKLRFTHPKN